MLVHDRYAVVGGCAIDLVTGDEVAADEVSAAGGSSDENCPTPLLEVFDHGHDGVPRWLVAEAQGGAHAGALIRRAAMAARRRGYVPISIALHRRFKEYLAEALRDRVLLLIGGFGASPSDRAALVDAAAVSTRPHMLLTFRAPRGAGYDAVCEARSVYGVPEDAMPGQRRLPSPEVQRHLARSSKAIEFIRNGRHAAADRLLRDIIGSLERRGARTEAAGLWLIVAELLLDRGRVVDAEGACREAARLSTMAGDTRLTLAARLTEATARVDRLRLVDAEAIARAVLLAADDEAIRLRANATLARTLLLQHRLEEAGSVPLDIPDRVTLSPDILMSVSDVAVAVAIAVGRLFDAGRLARRAVDDAAAWGDVPAAVAACTSHLRVLCASGDLVLGEAAWKRTRDSARHAHVPLRAADARLIWVDALRRAGREAEANREVECLKRLSKLAPPRLLATIAAAECQNNCRHARAGVNAGMMAGGAAGVAVDLVRSAYDEADDGNALRCVLQRVARALSASRVDLVSADAGPVTMTMSVGAGPATTLGPRVLDSGIAIGLDTPVVDHQAASPIRRGSRLIGAVVCRWPVDRVTPAVAGEVLELTAAVVGPRLESMQGRARDVAEASASVPELVGSSAAMEEVRRAIARAARAPFAVLLEGESGTGKELVARAIHNLGPRRERRFCDVNCAALPDDLLESELFGHARGAFTGALVDRAGLFEDASGGTLFMDEVADLSPRAQAKLLRVVQQQEVRRIGETVTRVIDVRLIAAANRDLQAESAAGRFRHDLLYRLNVIRIRIPPLRERSADVPALARHFWQQAAARVGSKATLSPALLAELASYHWPGNVRELQNVMASLAVSAPPTGRVNPALLPPVISSTAVAPSMRLEEARDQFERRFIEVALARAGGSRTHAAAALGLSRQGLLKTMVRLGMRDPARRSTG